MADTRQMKLFPIMERKKAGQGEAAITFVNELLSAKAEGSQRTYIGIWKRFITWKGLDPETVLMEEVAKIDRRDAFAYLDYLKGRKSGQKGRDTGSVALSNRTIVNNLSILRVIFEHLVESRQMEQNPIPAGLLKTSVGDVRGKRKTEAVPFAKVPEIINSPPGNTQEGRRDRLLLAILFGTGIRLAELHKLNLGDIQTDSQGILYLRQIEVKGRKARDVVIPDVFSDQVCRYMEERHRAGCGSLAPLLVKYRGEYRDEPTGQRVSLRTISRIFKKAIRAAGLDPKRYSPHSARATAITKLLTDGLSHKEVQQFSGHSSIAMVEKYDKRRVSRAENPGRGLSYKNEPQARKPVDGEDSGL